MAEEAGISYGSYQAILTKNLWMWCVWTMYIELLVQSRKNRIGIYLRVGCEDTNWIKLFQDRIQW